MMDSVNKALLDALEEFVRLVENDTIRVTNEGREALIQALTNANTAIAKSHFRSL